MVAVPVAVLLALPAIPPGAPEALPPSPPFAGPPVPPGPVGPPEPPEALPPLAPVATPPLALPLVAVPLVAVPLVAVPGFIHSLRNRFHLYVQRKNIVHLRRRQRGNEGSIWDFLAGLGMGIVGFTILSEFVKPKCPVCGTKIERGVPICPNPNCRTELAWRA